MDGKALAPAGRILLSRTQQGTERSSPQPVPAKPQSPIVTSSTTLLTDVVPRIAKDSRILKSPLIKSARGRIFGSTTVFALAPFVVVLTPAWLHETAERPNVYRYEEQVPTKQVVEPLVAIPAIESEQKRTDPRGGAAGIPVSNSRPLVSNNPARIIPEVRVAVPKRAAKQPTVTDQVYQIVRRHAPKKVDAKALARAIVEESRAQKYDPLFVAAVIKSESTFNALAKSHVGARGLMQIMPATGRWLAEKMDRDPSRGSLTDPGYNLKLGITYLKHLEESYAGDRVFTLVAYNWGPGRVERAFGGRNRVPGEVAQYAIKILNDHRRWQHEFDAIDVIRPNA